MEDEVRRLRVALVRRESGRGRRFAPEVRRQISAVGRWLRDEGKSWFRIGREMGLPSETVRRLCEAAPGFAPVEVVTMRSHATSLSSRPSGYRVEGLDVETVVALRWSLACLDRDFDRDLVSDITATVIEVSGAN